MLDKLVKSSTERGEIFDALTQDISRHRTIDIGGNTDMEPLVVKGCLSLAILSSPKDTDNDTTTACTSIIARYVHKYKYTILCMSTRLYEACLQKLEMGERKERRREEKEGREERRKKRKERVKNSEEEEGEERMREKKKMRSRIEKEKNMRS